MKHEKKRVEIIFLDKSSNIEICIPPPKKTISLILSVYESELWVSWRPQSALIDY